MVEASNPSNERLAEARNYLTERQQWIADAVEVIGGDSQANPLEVLPAATEVRADAEPLYLSPESETALREIAGRFGIGGEHDLKSQADHQIIEGGLAWKIDAEIAIADAGSSLTFAGSPHRQIRDDEKDYLRKKLGEDAELPESEYELARILAQAQPGFEALENDQVLPFGYDIGNGFALLNEPTGQLVQIGNNNGRPVMVLRVDRENYTADDGSAKYRNQPDAAAIMGFIDGILNATGDTTSSVGLNTSNTYASRAIDTVRAGLAHNRSFRVGMYGRQTIANIKGEPVADPTPINQIPGELHVVQQKLDHLARELQQ